MGYTGCIYKIWSILDCFSQEQLLTTETQLDGKIIDTALKKSDFFVSLNYMIKKYFGKELRVEYVNGMISLSLADEKERISYFDDLSDGEKSLLAIIF